LCFGAAVTGAQKVGDDWRVELQNGDTVSAAQVVLCTGNWSQGVGALFGLQLPVAPVRAQITVMQRPPQWQGSFPVISDLVNLAYFRVEGQRGMWVGSSDMSDLQEHLPAPEGFNEAADVEAIEAARHKTALRFEGFDTNDKGDVQRAFCGLYETTPDWQPIIDSFGNVHVAVGFSGHGFKLAPVVGEEIAHRVASIQSPFDTSIFDLARFEEERLIKSRHVYRRARFLR
jgi:glycine/D-amino acid oxidase-like deaminating enzyme